MAVRPPYVRPALPPVPAGRRFSPVLSPAGVPGSEHKPPWWDMPAGKERDRASMLWNCDLWHRQGRTDLAQSLSDGFKLGWKPGGVRPLPQTAPQTAALSFDDGGESAESAESADDPHCDPFAERAA